MPRNRYYIYVMAQRKPRQQKKALLKKAQTTQLKHQVKRHVKSSKKILLKDTVNKVIDAIKKPFSKTDSTQQNSSSQQTEGTNQTKQAQSSQLDSIDVPFAESSSRTSFSKFFYTNDIDIQTFDDWQLYQQIALRQPDLSMEQTSELAKRNAVVAMLNDIEFMQQILEDYNMTILDFMKFLYRLSPSIFKGLFVRKIQKTLKDKPYAQSIRFGSYSRRKKHSSKKSAIVF